MAKPFLSWRELLVAALFLTLAALLQNTSALNILGIKPNLTLVVLITLSFFVGELVTYSILLLLMGLLLRVGGGFEPTILALTILALLVFGLGRHLAGKPFFNNIFLVAAGTLAFYVLADFRFLARDFLGVLGEMVYNVILGVIIFLLARRFLKNAESRITF